jgi:hypothetical protein
MKVTCKQNKFTYGKIIDDYEQSSITGALCSIDSVLFFRLPLLTVTSAERTWHVSPLLVTVQPCAQGNKSVNF